MKSRAEKKALGQFFSHTQLVKAILSHLQSVPDNPTMLDPSCGDGVFLTAFLTQFPKARVFGIDVDEMATKEAKKNLEELKGKLKLVQKSPFSLITGDALCLTSKLHQLLKDHNFPLQFDFILGNPPFFMLKNQDITTENTLQSADFTPILSSNNNIASLFLFRYLQYLKPGGQLFFIFPRSLLHVESFSKMRRILLQYHITHILDIGKAFLDVGLEQIIIGLTNSNNENRTNGKLQSNENPNLNRHLIHYGLLKWNSKDQKLEESLSYSIPQDVWKNTPKFFLFIGQKTQPALSGLQIYKKIQEFGTKSILDFCMTTQQLGIDPIFRGWGFQNKSTNQKQNEKDIQVFGGRNIFNFGTKKSCRYIPYSLIDSRFDQKRDQAMCSFPKILVQNLASSKIRLVATFDDQPTQYTHDLKIKYTPTFDTITNIIPLVPYARFILALLTSEFCTYYFRDFIFLRQTLTLHVDKKYLLQIPFPDPTPDQLLAINEMVIDIENYVHKQNLIYPVEERKRPSWENPLSPEYQLYFQKKTHLDQLIYELFQLTKTEQEFISLQLKEFDENF